MQKRAAIIPSGYLLGLLFSALIHLSLMNGRFIYAASSPELMIDRGTASVTLTLLPPAIASVAHPEPEPRPTPPAPDTPPAPASLPPPTTDEAERTSTEEPEISAEQPPENETTVEQIEEQETAPEPEAITPPVPEPPTEPATPASVHSLERSGNQFEETGLITKAALKQALNVNNYYPRQSMRRGHEEEGTCYVAFTVSPTGRATNMQIHQSSGYQRLDKAAIRLIGDAQFTPARQNGTPIESTLIYPILFRLK
jgi:periplasmic protein TonB